MRKQNSPSRQWGEGFMLLTRETERAKWQREMYFLLPRLFINWGTCLSLLAAKTSAKVRAFLYFWTYGFVLWLWLQNHSLFNPVLFRLSCVWYDLLTLFYPFLRKVKNNLYDYILNSCTDKYTPPYSPTPWIIWDERLNIQPRLSFLSTRL